MNQTFTREQLEKSTNGRFTRRMIESLNASNRDQGGWCVPPTGADPGLAKTYIFAHLVEVNVRVPMYQLGLSHRAARLAINSRLRVFARQSGRKGGYVDDLDRLFPTLPEFKSEDACWAIFFESRTPGEEATPVATIATSRGKLGEIMDDAAGMVVVDIGAAFRRAQEFAEKAKSE